MARVDNYTLLTKGPVGKVIIRMAVPTIISMLVTSVYNLVDSYYVGQINTQATAAVGVAFPVMSVMQAVGFFFGQGTGTYISRLLGAKHSSEASSIASTGFYSSILFGIVLGLLGLIFLEPLARVCGSTATVLPYTKSYMGIILLGTPVVCATMVLNNQMRFQGNAATAMYGLVVGAVLNVALVPLFTFSCGLGITGTAIGTVVSQVAALAVLVYLSRHGENIHMNIKEIAFSKTFFTELFKGGTPSMSRQGLAALATMLLNLEAGGYGDAAIAGMSIVGRVSFVVFAVVIGIGQGFQPFCGFNYGAGLYGRVRQGYSCAVRYALTFLAVCCMLCFALAPQVVDVMRHDAEVVRIGAEALRWQVLSWPLVPFVIIGNMALQTSGWAISANVVAATRNGICFIPLILLLPMWMGLMGVEVCQAVADVLSFLIAVPLTINYFKALKKR